MAFPLALRRLVHPPRASWHIFRNRHAYSRLPGAIKSLTVREYAYRFGLATFVETGTYLGDMLWAVHDVFSRCYSIEVDDWLYQRACRRFRHLHHVTIIHGDSENALPALIRSLDGSALFWLDGHYSGGITSMGKTVTPIMAEIRSVLAADQPSHVVLVDDARCFGVDPGYPSLDELRNTVQELRPGNSFEVRDGIIRINT